MTRVTQSVVSIGRRLNACPARPILESQFREGSCRAKQGGRICCEPDRADRAGPCRPRHVASRCSTCSRQAVGPAARRRPCAHEKRPSSGDEGPDC
ncbi:hypothetical protein D8O27_29880 [Burkholderia mallei]|uniref:Uncharacterized protein n=2 Tax=Burkholderia mallei TaxID=13373 RepID=A0AAX1XD08_BURML|nr:hypothetical protein BMAA1507 [Burkholderia mallei ATCC 23344]RKN90084.1 hypothetical protein D8O31_30040 [Burkholderia mallei]RKN90937.1 hypothetical protein D8O03_30090 [Burkholderia mallei]RKN93697.1 hypothetical protein D8O05_29405 [Burkholderia mallei]RKO06014.1 hypothetical protein D8O04_29420 [Burkholderia mallei]